jgi:hypothetical protein
MRRELFSLHLPNPVRVTADYAVLAGLSRGLSGGDAGDAGAGDCEGEEGDGRALG